MEKPTVVWDCDSTLYDSFELNSFNRHLQSAITSSRTFSMPHLSDRKLKQPSLPPPAPAPPASASEPSSMSKSSSSNKFSRSVYKLLRSIFRQKPNSWTHLFRDRDQPRDGFYVFYEVGSLSTIPEVPEQDVVVGVGVGAAFSPEISSLVKKTNSERFTARANSLGISCA